MELSNILQQSACQVIDVREKWEYMLGHMKGSQHIPLGRIPEKVDSFRSAKGPLVFCCASGNRSGQAVAFLRQQGLKNIHNGGSWRQVKQAMPAT